MLDSEANLREGLAKLDSQSPEGAASSQVGGRVLEQGESEFVIRSSGYVEDRLDLEQVVVYAEDGTPVTLADVSRIVEGPALRRGIADLNGAGETVAGIVVMRDGENALDVIRRVKAKLEDLQRGLPEGVRIVTTYDRAPLIEGAGSYLSRKLIEEGIAVALVIFVFLLHLRSAVAVLITLPLGVLGAFVVMSAQGITANIMSLGGIALAIGTMVDASIVMVENASRRLSELGAEADRDTRRRAVVRAVREVGPGVSSTKIREILGQTNRVIAAAPEIESVFGKAGRADTATDPAPLTMIETWIRLKPRSEWRGGMTPEKLIEDLNSRLQMPGLFNSWGYPINIRMDMVSTGVRTPVGVKITGDDLGELERLAREVEAVVGTVPGTRAALADRVLGGNYLEILPDRSELARRNIDMGVFQSVIQTALGGMKLAESVQGRERYDIMLRYDWPFRETRADLEDILVPTPAGAHIPLGELARLSFTEGPPMIRSENARLTGWVFVDIEGRDLGGYVSEARSLVGRSVDLPPGYVIEWSGQYEQIQAADARLNIAVPAVVGLIFLLLMLHFGRFDRTAMIMLSLPFGLIGGLWAVWLAGYNLSVAVAVGFIALGGVAAETAVVMVMYIDNHVREDKPANREALALSISAGSALRLRPILMTVITVLAGLAPIFLSDGLGADVMRRIALPMLGGMVSTVALTLLVIPAVYFAWVGRRLSPAALDE